MKDHFEHYKVPFKGLHNGPHHFTFEVDDAFFRKFENATLDNGDFEVALFLNKKDDHTELHFDVKGSTMVQCDRCLKDIRLPIEGEYKMYVKYSEESGDDEDIIYLSPAESALRLEQSIFEIISVLLPIRKVCEEVDDKLCNEEYLNIEEEEVDRDSEATSPMWDALKGLKFDK